MVCTQPDDFVLSFSDFGKAMWVAELSNGEHVFQDDDRPGTDPGSAWLRLKEYVESNKLSILGMRLEFRSNVIYMPTNVEGYFFRKALLAAFFSTKSIHYYVVGTLENGIVKGRYWKVPELLPSMEKEYDPNDPEVERCLIRNEVYNK